MLARLRLRLELPGIDRRREDIPQLAVHLLRRIAQHDPGVARRCFPDGDPSQPPRITIKLMDALVRWPYTTHVRELEALLWRAMASGTGDTLELWPDAVVPGAAPSHNLGAPEPIGARPETPEVRARTVAPTAVTAAARASRDEPQGHSEVDPLSIPPELLQARLDAHGGRQEPVWREFGFSSRHVLTRLVRRHNLRVRGRTGEDDES